MDLSALIFVALAVAWAVYLIPKALKHHDDVIRSRSVDRFSHTMRVLARREPVDRRNARLVVTPGRGPSAPVVETKASSSAPPAPSAPSAPPASAPLLSPAARREAANRAARRRRRVLITLVLALVVTATLAALDLIASAYVAAPVGLLVAWLVACRLMVRQERGITRKRRITSLDTPDAAAELAAEVVAAPVGDVEEDLPGEVTEEIGTVHAPIEVVATEHAASRARADAGLWDPMPVTLPTYVSKPAAARRSVRTIDLDATGVWTSGRTEGDAALARGAEEADRVARERRDDDGSRALGS
ncbi:MAG: hypothetical protein F2667_10140 [Actinobacteria bacterium]|uniref:Unannotated protein n=1 Tax=freshwater metagenome TaxID=449393 RepID=A0A6J6R9C9_9ZZZZ|nr:hypothetical protein [Actinomycetota bacterium]